MILRRPTVVIIIIGLLIAAVLMIGCGKKVSPELKLQVAPLGGVFVQYESKTNAFRIGNDLVERRISINPERNLIYTLAFINKFSRRNYIRSLSEEFYFRANGIELSGATGDLEYVSHEVYGSGGMRGLEINLRAAKENIGILGVKLIYEVYSKTPVIRKWFSCDHRQHTGGAFEPYARPAI